MSPRDEGHRLVLAQRRPRRLEKLAVRNSARADGLARSASETLIDVLLHARIIGLDRALEQRPHEKNASARTVVLVLEIQVRRARLEAESAVHARIDSRQRVGERRAGKRAARHRIVRKRVSGEARSRQSPSMPGLRMLCGSYARLMPCDNPSDTTLGENHGPDFRGQASRRSTTRSTGVPWRTRRSTIVRSVGISSRHVSSPRNDDAQNAATRVDVGEESRERPSHRESPPMLRNDRQAIRI